jgi:hypothetical protein
MHENCAKRVGVRQPSFPAMRDAALVDFRLPIEQRVAQTAAFAVCGFSW